MRDEGGGMGESQKDEVSELWNRRGSDHSGGREAERPKTDGPPQRAEHLPGSWGDGGRVGRAAAWGI